MVKRYMQDSLNKFNKILTTYSSSSPSASSFTSPSSKIASSCRSPQSLHLS